MAESIDCFRCGASLAALTLPISRRDHCPECSAAVHVCRMCTSYARDVIGQCLEEAAEEVLDKDNSNYCEWFKPRPNAFDAADRNQQERAAAELDALFGEPAAGGSASADDAAVEAEKLFD